jgi:hypothetical protein
MSDGDKYSDIFRGPRQDTGGVWDKPVIVDDKSLPSREDSTRFNVAIAEDAVEEARAKAAAKEARTRAAYGGAPRLDDTTPPWVDRGEEAPEEWSPTPRPWWKSGLLAAAMFLLSLAFVFSVAKPLIGKDAAPAPAENSTVASVVASAEAGPSAPPPPLMANPVADGTMKFQVLALSPNIRTVVPDGADPVNAEGVFLVVDMKVTNADTQPRNFDPLFQEIVTNTGRQYGPRLEAQRSYSGPEMITSLAPGQNTTVRMAFDIPASEAPSMLLVHATQDSYGTSIKFAP